MISADNFVCHKLTIEFGVFKT
uniref:Uncharacterized protein n=1 Tax=Arundo donax TaxID=35708 RepID=A0A0A9A6E1_ARUDO